MAISTTRKFDLVLAEDLRTGDVLAYEHVDTLVTLTEVTHAFDETYVTLDNGEKIILRHYDRVQRLRR